MLLNSIGFWVSLLTSISFHNAINIITWRFVLMSLVRTIPHCTLSLVVVSYKSNTLFHLCRTPMYLCPYLQNQVNKHERVFLKQIHQDCSKCHSNLAFSKQIKSIIWYSLELLLGALSTTRS